MLGDEGSADRTLFHGIDTHYLALSALDLMMEATTVSSGSTSVEVVAHLGYIASRMKPGLTSPQARRIAEVVLDALDNKANNQRVQRGVLRCVRRRRQVDPISTGPLRTRRR